MAKNTTKEFAANVAPDDTNTAEAPVAPAPLVPTTGFIIYTYASGDFYITGDLTDTREVERPANNADFRHGAQDVLEYLSNENLLNQLAVRTSAVAPV